MNEVFVLFEKPKQVLQACQSMTWNQTHMHPHVLAFI